MSPLFKYLQESLSVDILIPQEEKNKRKIIKVREEKEEAKLKEILISYDKEKFEVLALTLLRYPSFNYLVHWTKPLFRNNCFFCDSIFNCIHSGFLLLSFVYSLASDLFSTLLFFL